MTGKNVVMRREKALSSIQEAFKPFREDPVAAFAWAFFGVLDPELLKQPAQWEFEPFDPKNGPLG